MPTLVFTKAVKKEPKHYHCKKTDKTTWDWNYKSKTHGVSVSPAFLSAWKRNDPSARAELMVLAEAQGLVPNVDYLVQECQGRDRAFHRDRGGFHCIGTLRIKKRKEEDDEDED